MKKQLFVLFVAALSALGSCKEDDNNDPDPNPGKGKVLSKVTRTDKTPGGDSTSISNLTFDNSNRLTSMKINNNAEVTNFTYDASGNLNKMEHIEGNDKTIFQITYQNNVPKTGSFITYENNVGQDTLNLIYTVSNGVVTQILQKAGIVEYAKSTITYADNNVSKVKTELTGLPDMTTTLFYTYGSKKNPFASPAFKYIIDPYGLSVMFNAKNEITGHKYDGPGTILDFETITTYTYDSNGYPLTATEKEGNTVTATVKFDYK